MLNERANLKVSRVYSIQAKKLENQQAWIGSRAMSRIDGRLNIPPPASIREETPRIAIQDYSQAAELVEKGNKAPVTLLFYNP